MEAMPVHSQYTSTVRVKVSDPTTLQHFILKVVPAICILDQIHRVSEQVIKLCALASQKKQLTQHSNKSVRLRLDSQVSSHKEEAPHSSPVQTLSYVGDGQRVEGRSDRRSGAIHEANHTGASTQE